MPFDLGQILSSIFSPAQGAFSMAMQLLVDFGYIDVIHSSFIVSLYNKYLGATIFAIVFLIVIRLIFIVVNGDENHFVILKNTFVKGLLFGLFMPAVYSFIAKPLDQFTKLIVTHTHFSENSGTFFSVIDSVGGFIGGLLELITVNLMVYVLIFVRLMSVISIITFSLVMVFGLQEWPFFDALAVFSCRSIIAGLFTQIGMISVLALGKLVVDFVFAASQTFQAFGYLFVLLGAIAVPIVIFFNQKKKMEAYITGGRLSNSRPPTEHKTNFYRTATAAGAGVILERNIRKVPASSTSSSPRRMLSLTAVVANNQIARSRNVPTTRRRTIATAAVGVGATKLLRRTARGGEKDEPSDS